MKHLILLAILSAYNLKISAQNSTLFGGNSLHSPARDPSHYLWSMEPSGTGKPAIDFPGIDHWIELKGGEAISPDGLYFTYIIKNQPYKSYTLIVQSTSGPWKHAFVNTRPGFFSRNSKQYILKMADSLCFLPLGKGQPRYIQNVSTYQHLEKDKNHWIIWQLKNSDQTLILQNLITGKEQKFNGVVSYSFENSGQWLTCRLRNDPRKLLLYNLATGKMLHFSDVSNFSFGTEGKTMVMQIGVGISSKLQWIQLSTERTYTIWQPEDDFEKLENFTLDKAGTQVVFILRKGKAEILENTIWYYKLGMEKAVLKVHNHSPGIAPGLFINGPVSFISDDRYIHFVLNSQDLTPKPVPNAVQLDVWNYRDTMLQSVQLLDHSINKLNWRHPKAYQAVIGVEGKNIIRLTTNDLKLIMTMPESIAVVMREVGGDRFWEKPYIDSIWLVSLQDGYRTFLKKQSDASVRLSPEHKYLVYFDEEVGHYYSYELVTGKRINISAAVPVYLGTEIQCDPYDGFSNDRTGIAGWLERDEGLLVYDNYDIWKLDLSGKKTPVNLTNGYGRKHCIKLRLMGGSGNNGYYANNIEGPIFFGTSSLLLTAFNTRNMDNGFFQKSIDQKGYPELLSIGPNIVDINRQLLPNNGSVPSGSLTPLKAQDAATWIIRRQTVRDAPNYFITKDFKQFRRLTDVQPHTGYNWMNTELISFQQLDGTFSQGILYKPENFDSAKQYPVLLNYYFQYSQSLHEYIRPYYAANAFLDIPWFVSRGYLVFTPDIYFTRNRSRPASALNTVEGAARYLSKLSFVDSTRMGISGHSRGGGYTNYILTQTNRFAAVFEGAGVSDWVSAQLQLVYTDGRARLSLAQQEPFFSESKEVLKENPIINVDKIMSPLLILHNKGDAGVPWEQAVELFVAMRSLDKRVWMLQYDGEQHHITKPSNFMDFTVRVTQFFDYYLKGAPPPRWMTTGVPARLKGIDAGLELDTSGRRP